MFLPKVTVEQTLIILIVLAFLWLNMTNNLFQAKVPLFISLISPISILLTFCTSALFLYISSSLVSFSFVELNQANAIQKRNFRHQSSHSHTTPIICDIVIQNCMNTFIVLQNIILAYRMTQILFLVLKILSTYVVSRFFNHISLWYNKL